MSNTTFVIAVVAGTLGIILGQPSIMAKVHADNERSANQAVANLVCRSAADAHWEEFKACIHRALPDLPPDLTNMPPGLQ